MSAKSFLPYSIIFPGFRDQDPNVFGGQYPAYHRYTTGGDMDTAVRFELIADFNQGKNKVSPKYLNTLVPGPMILKKQKQKNKQLF